MKNADAKAAFSYRFTDPALKLDESELTAREQRLLKVLRKAQCPMSIDEMAKAAFRGQENAYFTTKNQLRRLVVARFVKQLARGVYEARR